MTTSASSHLRVLVLSRNYPNDVQPQLGLWTERLVVHSAIDCEPTVIAPVPYCPPLPKAIAYTRFRRIAPIETRHGVTVHRPRFVIGPGQLLHQFEADAYGAGIGRLAARLFKDQGFDLIHAHFTYPDGVAAARLGARYRVPVVITEHALWSGWMDRYPRVRRQAIGAARAAAWHLAVSRAGSDSIARFTGVSPRLRVLPVGVDAQIFRPEPATPRKAHQILFVGFLNATKGVDVLLHALVRITKRDPEARLVLVGGAFYRNTHLQAEGLRRLAADLGLVGVTDFRGLQPPETVAALMRESAVLVLPSRRESFGSVLVEALACGTPVVATACGGPEDIVTDAVGQLVPVENAERLADAVLEVMSSVQYSPTALADYAVTRFSLPRIARQLSEFYRAAVNGDGL